MASNSNYISMVSNVHDRVELKNQLHRYQFAHCMYPQKLMLWDCIQGKFVEKQVSCGHCYHCVNSKSADLVTRMQCHNQTWPHRYFITLTYAPIYLPAGDRLYPYNHDIKEMGIVNWARMKEFEVTLPVYDGDNENGRCAWHPCILSRAHLTNYIKRLRKSLPGKELSTFGVGELGHLHGRPHYHLIIWSKEPIDKQKFIDAWSKVWRYDDKLVYTPYKGKKDQKAIRVYFGDVKVVDLDKPEYFRKENGGVQQCVADVFRYVAKYVGKYSSYTPIQPINNKIFQTDEEYEKEIKKRTEDGRKLCPFNYSRVNKAVKHYGNDVLRARYYYEKHCIDDFSVVHPHDEPDDWPLVPYSKKQFYRTFSPFAVSSCTYAIGKEFYLQNKHCLLEGLSKLPTFDGSVCRFPTYFQRLIDNERYALRLCKPSKELYTLCKGNVTLLHENLLACACSPFAQDHERYIEEIGASSVVFSKKLGKRFQGVSREQRTHLYDLQERLHIFYNFDKDIFDFKSRKDGEYVTIYSLSVDQMYRKYLPQFEWIFHQREVLDTEKRAEDRAYWSIIHELNNDCDGLTLFEDMRNDVNEQIEKNLSRHQRNYYAKKKVDNSLL